MAGIVLVGYVARRISVVEYGVLLLAMSLCSMMFMLDLGLSALRKNLTEPTVLLGFREGLFPGAADVWKRRDSPGANVHGAFRSIQAL